MLAAFAGQSFASSSIVLTVKDSAGGKEYHAVLEDNGELSGHLPLTLTFVRYGGHEYYADLPFKPDFTQEGTSQLKAGHLYYWAGGNSLVINYEDCDISPYKDVHLGAIEEDISAQLRESEGRISVTLKGEK